MTQKKKSPGENWVKDQTVEEVTAQILDSNKYSIYGLPYKTVQWIVEDEYRKRRTKKGLQKAARQKLHNIMAPYLGDPEFTTAHKILEEAFRTPTEETIKSACASILSTHLSTKERLPILSEFYKKLFAKIGKPVILLDLACGLNPFTFPFMDLPATTNYYAYDLNQPRIKLIQHYFELQGLPPLAKAQDILLDPPNIQADAAFFFKEAHRFEQRQAGSNRGFWEAIMVKYLLVSLPTTSMSGKHSLLERHRKLVYDSVAGFPWGVDEIIFENEIVFIIDKG